MANGRTFYSGANNTKPYSGNGFVALGDSISTASTASAGGGGYGGAWPHLACALSNQRLNFAGNAGVAGENSTQIAARVSAVIALKPSIVTVLAGTNDLTQGVTFATWSANIRAIASTLKRAGIRVVLCTIPPRNVTTYLQTQLIWNRWLSNYAAANGHDLLDFFGVLTDSTTGTYKSGYNLDGIHPTQAAHVALAIYVRDSLATSAFVPISPLLGGGLDTGNLIANAHLTTGGPTPTGFAVSGTGGLTGTTEALVTDTDFKGKAWEIAFANPSSATGFRLFANTGISTGWTAGDLMLFTARVKVVSASGVTPGVNVGLTWEAFFNGAASVSSFVPGLATVTPAGMLWFTATVPAGTTNIQLVTNVKNIPTTGSLTARVGEFGIYNLSGIPA